MSKKYWRIRGHRKDDIIFDQMIPLGSLAEMQFKELLKCMAANGSLSYQEIIGAYVKRKMRLAHEILAVQKNGPYPEYFCGNDPSFTAMIVDENGDRVKHPSV